MPPRNRNQQPPMLPDEEPLPVMDNGMTLDQLNAMNSVNMTEEDMLASGMVPDAVANDLAAPEPTEVRRAEPAMQPTGAFMDLGFINQINSAATDEEATAIYNTLDPVQKRVYDRSYGINISPEWAANEAAKYYEEQDRRNSPEAKLAETKMSAIEDKTKDDAQKTYQRASNMLFLLDNLRGGRRENFAEDAKGAEKWRSRVGTVQGRWPSILSDGETLGWNADFASLKGMINLDEAQRNRGQGSLSDGERVLMAQAASLGLEQARDEQGFEAAFERMYDMALEAQQKSMSKLSGEQGASGAPAVAGAPAPQQQTRKVGNQTWVKTKDGWVPQR